MRLFTVGRSQLLLGHCDEAKVTKNKITDLMYIPLIQGTLRSAYMLEHLQGGEKEKGEGAAFAAAVLPRIHAANADAANIIYSNMKVGSTVTNFKAVKEAFESTYSQINVECDHVGGLWISLTRKYYPDASPCNSGSLSITLIGCIIIVAIANMFVVYFLYRRKCKGRVRRRRKVDEVEFKDVDTPVV